MLCSVSVDLDEIPLYHAIHGLPPPVGAAAHAVYDLAVPRLQALARAHHIPLTLFAVGADAARPENGAKLKEMAGRGHEIGNHSLDHLYDLAWQPADIQRHQVLEGAKRLEEATGQRPKGFRSPGYGMTNSLSRVLRELEVGYDSSVFPCPAYYGVKASALGLIRLRGRKSRSVLGSPAVLAAPTRPYRMGMPYWCRGSGVLELPIQVTRRVRLPFIGTTLTVAGPTASRFIVNDVIGEPMVNLELHGLDVLDDDDGLGSLLYHQLDLRVPLERKLESLSVVIEAIKQAGYSFVTLGEAADRWGASPSCR